MLTLYKLPEMRLVQSKANFQGISWERISTLAVESVPIRSAGILPLKHRYVRAKSCENFRSGVDLFEMGLLLKIKGILKVSL